MVIKLKNLISGNQWIFWIIRFKKIRFEFLISFNLRLYISNVQVNVFIFMHILAFLYFFLLFLLCSIFLTKAWTNYYIYKRIQFKLFLSQKISTYIFFLLVVITLPMLFFVQPRQENQHDCHDWSLTIKCRRPINAAH